jgi:VanZ family protein
MRTMPASDLVLVVVEFVGLILATWIAWFVVTTVYEIWSRKTKGRRWLR